nr:hypothetical protein [Actinomycetes bacterium]
IAKVVKQLRPLRSATIAINGTTETFPPEVPEAQQKILASLNVPEPGHQANVRLVWVSRHGEWGCCS